MDNRITGQKVPIDELSVHAFFDNRQNKKLPHRYNYVNYQDNNPELVFERDKKEKERVGKYFPISSDDFILDIGCGVGRWGDLIIPILAKGRYVGVDYTQYFIDIAKEHFAGSASSVFLQGMFQDIETVLKENNEYRKYSRILVNGVLMYMNDSSLEECLCSAGNLLGEEGILYIKETAGMKQRLTLKNYYSEELSADYTVIYRSLNEYTKLFSEHFFSGGGYALISCGPTWDDGADYRKQTANWFWIIQKTGKS